MTCRHHVRSIHFHNLYAKYPGIKNASYDFGTGQFLGRGGMPIYRGSEQGFDKAAKSEGGRAARSGESTLRRGIFIQSLISGKSGERSALLGQLLDRSRSLTESSLDGLFTAPLPSTPAKKARDAGILAPRRCRILGTLEACPNSGTSKENPFDLGQHDFLSSSPGRTAQI